MAHLVQTMRFPVRCSAAQHRRMTEIFGMCAELYNAALESWRGTYAWWREHHPDPGERFPRELTHSKYDLMKQFTGVRSDFPEWERLAVQVGRGVLCRFDRAVRSFYRRCARGESPGYPRFKPSRRWRSIEIPDPTPSMLMEPNTEKNQSAVWWRLRVKGVPRLRFRDKGHRLATAFASGARVAELRVVRTALRTELHVVLKHPERPVPESEPSHPVGIDKGLSHRLVLSDGTRVQARQPDRSAIKRAQRKLSRAKKGSAGRAKRRQVLARAHRREKERATQADFRLAHRLVSIYDGIAVEHLNVAAMLKSKRFSRKISDQRWSALDRILDTKPGKLGSRMRE